MPHEIVEQYLNDTLKPQLAVLNTPSELIEHVLISVREQMLSCIRHWNDISFRKALLIVGEEEGAFYLPKANADIRNFVVVTLRNSALESIHADSYRPTGKSKRLSQNYIKTITSAAIEYFMRVDLPLLTERIGPLDHDKYGNLTKRYPVSWTALTQLSSTTNQIIDYKPIPILIRPSVSNLKPQQAVNGAFFSEKQSQLMYVAADGYSLTVDPGLLHTLQTIVKDDLPFIGDGFKTVSRNIEKLLTVMEFVMGNECAFITSNYLMANGHIERRTKPLKPGHDLREVKRNWLNHKGLTKNHKTWLQVASEV